MAASILLAFFAGAGIYASRQAGEVYSNTAANDWLRTNSTVRTATLRNEGPSWEQLSDGQRSVLAPLEEQWREVSESQKRRWLLIAESFNDFSADEQQRIAEHMKDWAQLSLGEHSQARMNYSNATNLTPEQKRMLWQQYQALSARERKRLAQGGALRPGGVALAPPGNKGASRLVKVPAAAINPNWANPPKILPPPEIRIQSHGVVTPVEVGPLPALAPSLPAAAAETAPVQMPAPITPSPLPPLAPHVDPHSYGNDSPIDSPA